jgi:GNAT superfamily N-acetyltransferase
MNAVAIHRAASGDDLALSAVGAATFLETFAGVVNGVDILAHCARQHAQSVYQAWLGSPEYALFLATIDPGAAPVGYAVLSPADVPIADPRPDDLEVKRIYLLSRFHGGGTGRALMDAALDEAKTRKAGRILIGVYEGNARAIAFYRKCGFAAAGTRRFSVGAGTYSDLLFAKDL